MAASSKRWAVTLSLLRGAFLLIGGLVAVFAPEFALKVVVVVGGTVLLVDGLLGALASQNYGIEASWPFWLSLMRGGLAALAGILLLASPLLAGVLTTGVLAWIIGVGAIVVGLTEAFILIRYRTRQAPVWSTVAGAAIYVVLGALLIALPMTGALLLMQIGGGLIALFGLIQIVRSWGAARERLAPG